MLDNVYTFVYTSVYICKQEDRMKKYGLIPTMLLASLVAAAAYFVILTFASIMYKIALNINEVVGLWGVVMASLTFWVSFALAVYYHDDLRDWWEAQ